MTSSAPHRAARPPTATVGVLGGGALGLGWTVAFARAALDVVIHEPDESRHDAVRVLLRQRLDSLAEHGLLAEATDEVAARVSVVDDLAAAVVGVRHVQECAPESLDLKRRLFAEIDTIVTGDTTVASSSSAIPISRVVSDLDGRSRYLVAHPGNPPYLLRVVEVVPAPFTDSVFRDRAVDLFTTVGMVPVLVNSEVAGFVFNRLQGAVLREAYCLVRDGVIDAADLDVIMTEGLGPRWSVIGPFATAHLNVGGGLRAHASRMGDAYADMGAERGQHDPWTPELVERAALSIEKRFPLPDWDAACLWRDRKLMRLMAHRTGDPEPEFSPHSPDDRTTS